MASWQDGAEYAPVDRPHGFAAPRVEPLAVPEDPVDLAAGHPRTPPAVYDATTTGPVLEELVPASGSPRDPHQPFDSASGAFVGDSAWGAAHSAQWHPTMPLGTPPAPVAAAAGPHAGNPPVTVPPGDFGAPTADWPAPGLVQAPAQPVGSAPTGSRPVGPRWPNQPGATAGTPRGDQLTPELRTKARKLVFTQLGILLLGGLVAPISFVAIMLAAGLEYLVQPQMSRNWKAFALAPIFPLLMMALAGPYSRWEALGSNSLLICWLLILVISVTRAPQLDKQRPR